MFKIIFGVYWLTLFIASVLAPVVSAKPLSATSCEPDAPITSESLVRLAIECSPSQLAATARWQSKQHAVDAAGRLEDPMIMVSAAPGTFGKDEFDDGYMAEINQKIPWPGTLSLQKEAAEAQANAWQARIGESRVALARGIRLAFADWQYHRKLLDINARHQRLWKEFIGIVEAKYAAGTADKSAVLQATHEASLLMEEAIELKALAIRNASNIKQLVGLPASAQLTSIPIESPNRIPLSEATFAAFLDRIEQQPAMQRINAEFNGTAAELALAKKDRYPDLSVMARYNSLQMDEEKQWMVGVGINVPFDFGKRSGRIRSIHAEQTALRYEQQDLVNGLREQLVQTYSLWQQGKEIYELYQNKLLPLADDNLETALQAYQSGADDFLTLLTAQRQTLTTQQRAEMALRAQFSALADLTAAAGLVWINDWQAVSTQKSTGE